MKTTTTTPTKARNGKPRTSPPITRKALHAPPVSPPAPAPQPIALAPGMIVAEMENGFGPSMLLRIQPNGDGILIDGAGNWYTADTQEMATFRDAAKTTPFFAKIAARLLATVTSEPEGSLQLPAVKAPATKAEPARTVIRPGMIVHEDDRGFGPSIVLRIESDGYGVCLNSHDAWFVAEPEELAQWAEDQHPGGMFDRIADRVAAIVGEELGAAVPTEKTHVAAKLGWVNTDFKTAMGAALDATAIAINAVSVAVGAASDNYDTNDLCGTWSVLTSAFDDLGNIILEYAAGDGREVYFDPHASHALSALPPVHGKTDGDPYHAALVSVNKIQARTAKAIESRWYGQDDELFSMVNELGDQFSDIERTLSYVSRAYLGMTAGKALQADHEPAAYDSPAERLAGKLWAIVERGRKTGLVGLDDDADTGKVFDALEAASTVLFTSIKKTRPPQAGGGK